MKRNPFVASLLAICAVAVLLHVVRFAVPSFSTFISDRTLLKGAGWVKLVSIATAAFFAFRSAALLERGNPARRAWLTLAAGLVFYTLGQGTLSWFQTLTGVSPFPSLADLWFMVAYPLLIVALVWFVVAYTRTGFGSGKIAISAGSTTILSVLLAWPLLEPVVRTPAAPLAMALNVAYPALDLVLLIPAVVLLRLTSEFRGGAVWRVWAGLLVGIVFTALGDIGFAWFSTLGLTRLDPLVHALYVVAYAAMVVGTSAQYRLLEPGRAGVVAGGVPSPTAAA